MSNHICYFKGSESACASYNETVFDARFQEIGTERWADIKERDGNFYIAKHPDYPAPAGMIEAALPPDPEDTDGI